MADDLDEVAENIRILVREELETQHRLEGHPIALIDCPICRLYAYTAGADGLT